jgi:hypothetical protein
VICNASMMFRVMQFPTGEFLANMQDVAKRIALPMETDRP